MDGNAMVDIELVSLDFITEPACMTLEQRKALLDAGYPVQTMQRLVYVALVVLL